MPELKKIYRIFNKEVKIKFIILVTAIIVGATIEMLCLAILSPIITILLDNSVIYSNKYIFALYNFFSLERIEGFLALLAFAVAFLYIFRGGYMLILNRVKFRFIGKNRIALSSRLLSKILRRPYIYHTKHNTAEFHKIILTDVDGLFEVINSLCQFLADSFTSAFILIFLFTESPLMSLCIVIAALICLSVYFFFFRSKIRKAGQVGRQKNIAMIKSFNQTFGGIKEVKVLRSEAYFENEYENNGKQFIRAAQRFQLLNSIPQLYIEAFCFGSAFTILAFIFLSDMDAASLLPLLSIFVFAAFRILPSLSRLANQVNTIIYNRPAIDAVYSNLYDEYNESDDVAGLISKPESISNDIEITDVTFKYPGSADNILEDISLMIPDKCSIAFIGASGAGKTTLADIILGILTPQKGGIFYNGVNVHTNLDEWGKYVGYIPQQIYILDESIRQNIAFGIKQEEINDDNIWYALEMAQLKDFVLSLPDQLDTYVGDRGIRLSGGQRQRIGIARALYRDPPILVLDEATSSLDSDTEKAVMEAIENFQGSKTMIIVAHRLSTIEHCDVVYRLEGKKVNPLQISGK